MTQPPFTSSKSDEVVCPFCSSAETELFAMFGQSLLASPHYCRSCKTVFDVVRWEEATTDMRSSRREDAT
jgi:phage FluMu protein Com